MEINIDRGADENTTVTLTFMPTQSLQTRRAQEPRHLEFREFPPGPSKFVPAHARETMTQNTLMNVVFPPTADAAKGVASIEKITTELIRTRHDLSRTPAN